MSVNIKYSVSLSSNDGTFMITRSCYLYLVQLRDNWLVVTKEGLPGDLSMREPIVFNKFWKAEKAWYDQRAIWQRNGNYRESYGHGNVILTDQEQMYLLLKY